VKDFEDQWLVHESQLKKYELNSAKFTHWEQRQSKTDKDVVEWVNMKSGEVTERHPGIKYFKANRKKMRERAEEHF
jgi:hypothetical protein